ncbi:LysR substrate-binding domain-containing protein [Pannonibacter indicus]|uniref:LysR substrate-binding domain-containing protein n=1 Tax=Pannonibacter indicus TaxID=466044 RepID=UPI00391D3D13
MLSYDRLRTPPVEPGITPIGDTSHGPVCSPDYPFRAQDGIWTAPVSLPHMEAAGSWQEWARRAGVTFQAGQNLGHPHHMLAIEAAAAGLGVALSERRLAGRDLATGRLAAPWASWGFVAVPGGFRVKITPKAAPAKPCAISPAGCQPGWNGMSRNTSSR